MCTHYSACSLLRLVTATPMDAHPKLTGKAAMGQEWGQLAKSAQLWCVPIVSKRGRAALELVLTTIG